MYSQVVQNTAYQDQVASANVIGGGSGGSGGDEYSASVEQEANQPNIGCVYSDCSNYADQSQTALALT